MGHLTFDFTNDAYAITGASSGMGREIATELAGAGAKVLAIGRNRERLAEVQKQSPKRIFPAALDVCDSKALEDTVHAFVQEHGKLSGGVHAAGISGLTPLRGGSSPFARQTMETSFWAGMEFLRLLTKTAYSRKGTSIVLFSSVCAYSHEKGMFAYAAAKAALEGGMRAAAKEIARRGHRSNAIVPGWVQSPMMEQASELTDVNSFFARHPLGAGKPEDICPMVLFLLSDASRWITGSSIVVDGGYLA